MVLIYQLTMIAQSVLTLDPFMSGMQRIKILVEIISKLPTKPNFLMAVLSLHKTKTTLDG